MASRNQPYKGAISIGQGIIAFVFSILLFFIVWYYNIGNRDGLLSLTSPGSTIFLILSALFLVVTIARLRIWLPGLVGGLAGYSTAALVTLLIVFFGIIFGAAGGGP